MVSALTSNQTFILVLVLLGLVGLAVLIDLGLFIGWALRKEDVDAGRKPPLFARRWSLVDVWIAGQVILILLVPITVILMFVAVPRRALLSGSAAMSPIALGVTILIQNALFVGVPALIIWFKYHERLRDIGLPPLPKLWQLGLGFAAGVGLLGIAAVTETAVTLTLKASIGPAATAALEALTKKLTAEGLFGGKMSLGMFLAALIGAGILAPIGEETFFRGFLYNCAKRRFGVTAAVLISSAAFALAHLGPIAVAGILVMGIVLALAYEITGSLWVTIIMHGVNNSAAVLIMYVMQQISH